MIIEALKRGDGFTQTERVLAAYILDHTETVVEGNIRELAESAFVSPPTISRLCRKLGLDGFNAFKVQLAAECNELTHKPRPVDANYPFREGDSLKEIAGKLADLSTQQIQAAYRELDYITLSKAVRAICIRRVVGLYGQGLSHTVTGGFTERMVRIGYTVFSSPDPGIQLCHAVLADKKQTALVISHSGKTRNVLRFIQKLHENGTPTLLITGDPASPMAQYATWVCCLTSSEKLAMQEKIESFSFQMAVHYLLDCLYGMIFADSYQANLKKAQLVNQEQFEL